MIEGKGLCYIARCDGCGSQITALTPRELHQQARLGRWILRPQGNLCADCEAKRRQEIGARLLEEYRAGRRDFAHFVLCYADLQEGDLQKINLSYADLTGADLSESNLSGANLTHATLCNTNLKGANLRGANLRWTHVKEADLSNATLDGADLRWEV